MNNCDQHCAEALAFVGAYAVIVLLLIGYGINLWWYSRDRSKKKSILWALKAVFWYWWDHGLPLVAITRWWNTAWYYGFHIRACYNDDPLLLDDEGTAREAVEIDVSYWEE